LRNYTSYRTTLPGTTFYLDAVQGGSVEKIFVEEGDHAEKREIRYLTHKY